MWMHHELPTVRCSQFTCECTTNSLREWATNCKYERKPLAIYWVSSLCNALVVAPSHRWRVRAPHTRQTQHFDWSLTDLWGGTRNEYINILTCIQRHTKKTQAEVKEWNKNFERRCSGKDIVGEMQAYLDALNAGCFTKPMLAAPDMNPAAKQRLLGWHGHAYGWYGDHIYVCIHVYCIHLYECICARIYIYICLYVHTSIT